MIWLISLHAIADPLIIQPMEPFPEKRDQVDHECSESVGLEFGAKPPDQFTLPIQCAATAVPVSKALHLGEVYSWAKLCRDQYEIVALGYATDLSNAEIERDRWKALAFDRAQDVERLQKWHRSPWFGAVFTLTAVGTGATIAVVAL